MIEENSVNKKIIEIQENIHINDEWALGILDKGGAIHIGYTDEKGDKALLTLYKDEDFKRWKTFVEFMAAL